MGIVASIFDSLPSFDSLKNVVTKMGVPGKSKSHAWVYDYCPIDQLSAEQAYCSDWLARKIVDLLPKHATREWRTWQADQAEQIYATEKQFQVRSKVREALIYDRLYGGGVILIGAQTANPEKPLKIDQVGRGGLKYLHVFHRYQLVERDIITDLDSPDFGKPEYYNLVASEGVDDALTRVKIHRSRFVFFTSIHYPGNTVLNAGLFSRGWGQSIYDHVMRAIIRAEAAAENCAALMEEAKIDVISVPDLPGQLSTSAGQGRLITRFTLANQLKSSNSLLLLGGEEKFDRKQISFAGLPEMMQTHLQISSGAADIPVVVLLGQSPAGLNATGESDTRMWYDSVKNFQGTDLQDALSPLDEVIIRHTLGRVPKGVEYEWDSLWQMSEAERADIAVKKATAIKTYVDTALFAPEELRPAVADVIIDDGFLPTLDQHMLDEDQMAELLSQQQEAEVARQQAALEAQGGSGTGSQGGQAPGQPGASGVGPGASQAGSVPKLRLVSGPTGDHWVDDEWKEEEHPRVAAGQPGGGQFTSGGSGSGEGETHPQVLKSGKGVWKGSPTPKDVWPFAASKNKGHHVQRFMDTKDKPAQDTPRYRAILNYLAHEAKYYGLHDEVGVLRQKAAQSYLLQSQKLASTDQEKSQKLHAKYLELTAKTGAKKEGEVVSTQTGKVEEIDWDKVHAESTKSVETSPSGSKSLEEKWAKLHNIDKTNASSTWQAAKQMELEGQEKAKFKQDFGMEAGGFAINIIVETSTSQAKQEWEAMSDAAKYQAAVKYGVVKDNPAVLTQVPEPPKDEDHPWNKLSPLGQNAAFKKFDHANFFDAKNKSLFDNLSNNEKYSWYQKATTNNLQSVVNTKTDEPKLAPKPPEPPKPLPASEWELQKAKNSNPYPKYGKQDVDQHIDAFNAKWAGKTGLSQDDLLQKVADFKTMTSLVNEAKAKAGHSLAQKAQVTQADKLQKLIEAHGKDQEDNIKALAGIAGAGMDYILTENSKGAYGLTAPEVALIKAYTGSYYKTLNAQLRDGKGSVNQYKYAKYLNKAMMKLPEYNKTTYRKATLTPAQLAKYEVGQAVKEDAFTSSAKHEGVWSGSHHFEIEGSSGRDVQYMSQHQGESEVLFPMNTMFEVTKKEGNKIWLREI